MRQVIRGLFVLLTLFLALMAMAKSKRYEVVFATQVQAGSMQLLAGTYQMEVEGGNATFYLTNKEVCKIAVKTEEVAKKIDLTTYETTGGTKLSTPELASTNTQLQLSHQNIV